MSDKIKTIVFDFDGVIVDSNRLKLDAWLNLFHPALGITADEAMVKKLKGHSIVVPLRELEIKN